MPPSMVFTQDLQLADGRILRVHDTGGPAASDAVTLLWHHGSPQTGAPLDPLVSAAAARGIRLLSYGRPSYGGSSPHPGRNVASAVGDVRQIVDALGVARFAVMGASGGGPYALACALSCLIEWPAWCAWPVLAPFTDGNDWYAGMVSEGGLRAAVEGRAARERYAASEVFDENTSTSADWAALKGAGRRSVLTPGGQARLEPTG